MTETNLSSVVADIGATNTRFSRLTSRGALGPIVKFPTTAFGDVKAALDNFLKLEGGARPARLGLAVAGPVFGDEVRLTNVPWCFSIRSLKKQMALTQLEVVNDLEALALVLPDLGCKDMVPVGKDIGHRLARGLAAVLCPGTGMGMAGLIPVDQGWRPIASEGGHISLSPQTDREMAVWQVLHKHYGRVSVERVLSGPGIAELYTALASLEGSEPEAVMPEDIVRLALSGGSALAVETIEMFCAWLGDVAGDVALMYFARGGVYLAGDILLGIHKTLQRSQFRDRFECKGRATSTVADFPTFLITYELPVLLGCAHLLGRSF